MKALRYFILLFALAFGVGGSYAESRFFKANSVRLKYVWFDRVVAIGQNPTLEYKYAEMWTGNDTIVDGYSCVTLWDQNEGEDPILIGYVREDENGFVWRYYLDFDKFADDGSGTSTRRLEKMGIMNDWAFLYDFSNPNWEEEMPIEVGDYKDPKKHVTRKLRRLRTLTAENGEKILMASNLYLIYGIGCLGTPFECKAIEEGLLYGAGVLEYWRDGELLLKYFELPDPVKSATKIEPVFTSSTETNSYDLTGRPANGTQKGIYIQNGKKVLVR